MRRSGRVSMTHVVSAAPYNVTKNTYWADQGRHKKKKAELTQKLETIVSQADDGKFNWRTQQIAHMALFNGVLGMYYGYYNDGDNAGGAVANNRVHGYQGDAVDNNLQAFDALAKSLGATDVQLYIKYATEANLERAMDEAILIAWEKENGEKE